jgi:hypothetical protein
MQNNKDAGQQDDDKLQPHDSCGRCWGEIVYIVLDAQGTNWRGTTSLSRSGMRFRAGRDRARVDRRRYAGIGKEREHASVGPAALGSHHIASISPRTQGQQLRNLAGKMVKK